MERPAEGGKGQPPDGAKPREKQPYAVSFYRVISANIVVGAVLIFAFQFWPLHPIIAVTFHIVFFIAALIVLDWSDSNDARGTKSVTDLEEKSTARTTQFSEQAARNINNKKVNEALQERMTGPEGVTVTPEETEHSPAVATTKEARQDRETKLVHAKSGAVSENQPKKPTETSPRPTHPSNTSIPDEAVNSIVIVAQGSSNGSSKETDLGREAKSALADTPKATIPSESALVRDNTGSNAPIPIDKPSSSAYGFIGKPWCQRCSKPHDPPCSFRHPPHCSQCSSHHDGDCKKNASLRKIAGCPECFPKPPKVTVLGRGSSNSWTTSPLVYSTNSPSAPSFPDAPSPLYLQHYNGLTGVSHTYPTSPWYAFLIPQNPEQTNFPHLSGQLSQSSEIPYVSSITQSRYPKYQPVSRGPTFHSPGQVTSNPRLPATAATSSKALGPVSPDLPVEIRSLKSCPDCGEIHPPPCVVCPECGKRHPPPCYPGLAATNEAYRQPIIGTQIPHDEGFQKLHLLKTQSDRFKNPSVFDASTPPSKAVEGSSAFHNPAPQIHRQNDEMPENSDLAASRNKESEKRSIVALGTGSSKTIENPSTYRGETLETQAHDGKKPLEFNPAIQQDSRSKEVNAVKSEIAASAAAEGSSMKMQQHSEQNAKSAARRFCLKCRNGHADGDCPSGTSTTSAGKTHNFLKDVASPSFIARTAAKSVSPTARPGNGKENLIPTKESMKTLKHESPHHGAKSSSANDKSKFQQFLEYQETFGYVQKMLPDQEVWRPSTPTIDPFVSHRPADVDLSSQSSESKITGEELTKYRFNGRESSLRSTAPTSNQSKANEWGLPTQVSEGKPTEEVTDCWKSLSWLGEQEANEPKATTQAPLSNADEGTQPHLPSPPSPGTRFMSYFRPISPKPDPKKVALNSESGDPYEGLGAYFSQKEAAENIQTVPENGMQGNTYQRYSENAKGKSPLRAQSMDVSRKSPEGEQFLWSASKSTTELLIEEEDHESQPVVKLPAFISRDQPPVYPIFVPPGITSEQRSQLQALDLFTEHYPTDITNATASRHDSSFAQTVNRDKPRNAAQNHGAAYTRQAYTRLAHPSDKLGGNAKNVQKTVQSAWSKTPNRSWKSKAHHGSVSSPAYGQGKRAKSPSSNRGIPQSGSAAFNTPIEQMPPMPSWLKNTEHENWW